MKVTMYSNDANHTLLAEVEVTHASMSKNHELCFHFQSFGEEQSKFMNALVKNYVLFKCQGTLIYLIPEQNNFQRVWFRMD